MENQDSPEIPREQIVYGEIIYWITILACIVCMIGPVVSVAAPDNNVLNPYLLFNAIFEGKTAEEIWNGVGGGFPGGHFYLQHPTYGDGLTQLGLALGCGCAFWGLLAVSAVYAKKKNWVFVILALWVATLVFLSMSGLVSGSH